MKETTTATRPNNRPTNRPLVAVCLPLCVLFVQHIVKGSTSSVTSICCLLLSLYTLHASLAKTQSICSTNIPSVSRTIRYTDRHKQLLGQLNRLSTNILLRFVWSLFSHVCIQYLRLKFSRRKLLTINTSMHTYLRLKMTLYVFVIYVEN